MSDIYSVVIRLLRTFVDTNIKDVGDIAVFKLSTFCLVCISADYNIHDVPYIMPHVIPYV